MLLSTADPMASHFSCLRPETSWSRTARSFLFLSSFWRSFSAASPPPATRAANASRVSPGTERDFVTGSRKTVTASWSSSRSLSAFSIPFDPAEASHSGGSR